MRVLLSDRFVSGAKAQGGAAQTDFFDEQVPGLLLRVSKTGTRTWSLFYSRPGSSRRARLKLGSYPGTSLARARALAVEAHGLLDEGRDPALIFGAQAAAGMTVDALKASYVQNHIVPRKLRTADAWARRYSKNVQPIIGSMRLADLHRREVGRVLDPILKRGKSVEAARVFEDLRAMFRWAVARGDLEHNPVEAMRSPGKAQVRERVLSDEEIKKLWNGLPKALPRSKAVQGIIRLCLLTGQRVGEVSGMRASELDLQRALWTIPGVRTKNKHQHAVPLSNLALELIGDVEEVNFLFPNEAGDAPLPAHAVAKTITKAQERFGLAHWTAHDLRRTAVSKMAELGVAPIVLGHIINHRSVTKAGVTLNVYSHYNFERERREALELWADRLQAIITGSGAKLLQMRSADEAA